MKKLRVKKVEPWPCELDVDLGPAYKTGKRGMVTGERGSSWRVKWNNLKESRYFSKEFIKKSI